MTTTPVSEYAAAVRAALSHVPETDRSELLEDLEDHLTEVAGESGEPLEARLGTPESYAAELYAAYLQRPDQRPSDKKRRNLLGALETRTEAFHTRVNDRFPGYDKLRSDFRPAWWLLRGYLISFAFWGFKSGRLHPIPWDTFDWLVLIVATTTSVILGYRVRDGRSRPLRLFSLGAGLLAGFVAFALLVEGGRNPEPYVYSPVDYQPHSDLANIYPYTKDGKPLKDVLLYDQHGNPIQLDYQQHGYEQIPSTAPRIPNSYPLPICASDLYQEEARLIPRCSASDPGTFPAEAPVPDLPTAAPAAPSDPSDSARPSAPSRPDASESSTPSPTDTPKPPSASPESSPTE